MQFSALGIGGETGTRDWETDECRAVVVLGGDETIIFAFPRCRGGSGFSSALIRNGDPGY
jgi:hypothetical protein